MGIHLSNNATFADSAAVSHSVSSPVSTSPTHHSSLSHSAKPGHGQQTVPAQAKRSTVADNVGIWLSMICLAHCLVLPIVATLGVLALPALSHEVTHIVLAALILPTTIWAAWHGYRHHRNAKVVLALCAGAAIITLAILVGEHLPNDLYETAITGAGSMLLVTGHWHNRTK